MAMWDRINQLKGATGRPGGGRSGSGGSGGGTRSMVMGALKSQLTSMRHELKSGAYRDASMAVCALVAAADGTVDSAERQHVEQMIVTNEVLQNFPADELRRRFNRHVDQLVRGLPAGRSEAMAELAKVAKKPAEARAVIQTGMVVAGADGYFSHAEAAVLREACAALALHPSEFGL
ncbi:TerB family tellurite resistance protein [Streptomyces sp. RFCAC02]|uniref:tellurite resistance TerB family protein n=1 Tax=Streptomyces sp. RFCAC02 TaxID=2499143 RepID=UPI001022586B|nr:TerB family tellurite resistance protein [Streptomyces sp. RFCAC02]